jgi:hypothetical protein
VIEAIISQYFLAYLNSYPSSLFTICKFHESAAMLLDFELNISPMPSRSGDDSGAAR